jgi:hypothetical protein
VACLSVALVLAFGYALVLVRTHFSDYDDEGFMLMTLRQYVEGLPLYDRVYTEYGPFYYVLLGNPFRLAGVTHDAIRLTTILFWLFVAVGWATCVWFWRRSLSWTLVTFLTTVSILRMLKFEPGHPQSLVLLLYAATFVAASFYRTSPALAFTAIGAASAAMLLTKINVGGLVVAALVAVFVACLRPERRPRALDRGVRTLCTLLPVALMHAQFRNPIAVMQCALYTFGIWAVLDALRRQATSDLDWPALGWAAVGFFSTVLLTVGSVLVHGTSVTGLVDGVILQPLRFGGAIPFQTPRVPLEMYLELSLAALCGVGGVVLWMCEHFRNGIPRYARAAAALAVIVSAVTSPRLAAVIAPCVMWMFVPGPGGRLWESRVPVFLVTVAATLGILMVYPVPGTQSGIAAAIVVLAAFAALLHSLDELLKLIAASEGALCASILYATLAASTWQVTEALNKPARAADHLPHSQMIQLSTAEYETFSEISSRTAARCDALVTIPGMNSFNIWSKLPHPNGSIVSSAMVLFDEAVQQQLVKDFWFASRPCVVWNSRLSRWSARYRRPRLREPFMDLVHHELVRVYARNGYEIRVPRGQASQWH